MTTVTTPWKGDDYDRISGPHADMGTPALDRLELDGDERVLDIGCGSLRAGRLFIPYLLPGHYYGLEPEKWVVDEAIKNEIGEEAGALDDMLDKSATYYEEQVDNAVDNLTSLMEPMIMSVLGVLVGGLIIAMYLPIFQLGAVVGG